MKLNKSQILAISVVVITVLMLAGITYTFFSSSVSNANNEKLQTQTATMSLRFDDNDNGVGGTLNLGEAIVKKFTLENTGTVDAYGKINWVDLVNTYTLGSLTWTLEQSTTENGTYTTVGSGKVPVSSTAITNVLKNGLLVPVGTTYYYKLTITFNNLDTNQNSDINASMHSKFNLEAGTKTGADTIMELVAGSPTNTTDEIDVPIKDSDIYKYVLSFNGPIIPEYDEYDSIEACQNDLSFFKEEFGSSVNAECKLNNSTGNYNQYVTGDSSASEYYYSNQESCESFIYNSEFENTSCIYTTIKLDYQYRCTNTLAYDGTTDNNLRYVGKDPCNYVTFNNEDPSSEMVWVAKDIAGTYIYDTFDSKRECTDYVQAQSFSEFIHCVQETSSGWRIIGVMNNVDDGTGKLETRIKLIRNEPLGAYSWDSSDSAINEGRGVNDWTKADLKNELNGDYLNTSLNANTIWYNGMNNQKTAEYDYTRGLLQAAQNLIGNTKWYLGGTSAFGDNSNGSAKIFYNYERGNDVWGSRSGQECADGACPRATSWTGKVALIYPSDYGFSIGGSDREMCLGKSIYSYSYYDCEESSYLVPPSYNPGNRTFVWTLTPFSNSYQYIFHINESGDFERYQRVSDNNYTYPVVYLKSDVQITGGNGTPESPYTLS